MHPLKECLFPLLWSCGQSETRFAIRRLFFQDIENIVLNRQTARFGFSDDSLFNFWLEFQSYGHGAILTSCDKFALTSDLTRRFSLSLKVPSSESSRPFLAPSRSLLHNPHQRAVRCPSPDHSSARDSNALI